MNGSPTDGKRPPHLITGTGGEDAACKFLEGEGYTVVCRNFRATHDEIDIIAETERYIVFVEVKTRRYTSYARPVEWVTKTKQNRIINTALMYLSEHKTNLNIRFDVIEIITGTREFHVIEYNHIKNAFMMGW